METLILAKIQIFCMKRTRKGKVWFGSNFFKNSIERFDREGPKGRNQMTTLLVNERKIFFSFISLFALIPIENLRPNFQILHSSRP